MTKPLRALILTTILAAITTTAWSQSTRRTRLHPVRTVTTTTPAATTVCGDTITDRGAIDSLISISGFRKAVASRVESLILTNLGTTDTIRSLTIDIDYRTTDGTQLNRRTVTLETAIPPGESRHVSFKSWDRQQLFYHIDTPPVRRSQRTSPFTVSITPLRLVVR